MVLCNKIYIVRDNAIQKTFLDTGINSRDRNNSGMLAHVNLQLSTDSIKRMLFYDNTFLKRNQLIYKPNEVHRSEKSKLWPNFVQKTNSIFF